MGETNISVMDTKSLSEPLSKLIESVSNGIGVLYEPRRIRQRAKAEAEAAIILAKADVEIKDLAARAEERVNAKELRRQQNIESIVEKAAGFLPESVSSEKVDPDWTIQFFEQCQDVGNEEMQSLWARLLAGEVAQPGSYSLRTLQTVKLLKKEDADLFTKFCSYMWHTSEEKFFFHIYTNDTLDLLKDRGLRYFEFVHLDNIGLINHKRSQLLTEEKNIGLHYFKGFYFFNHAASAQLLVYPLTSVGNELAPVCGSQPDEGYRICLAESLAKSGTIVRAEDG